jgi:5-formyltetrahydrofolate cyclo-ligase
MAQPSLLEQKRALRHLMRTRRERLDAAERVGASRAAAQALAALPEFQAARTFSAFVPTRGEIDLSEAITARVDAGARLALPRVFPDPPRMRFFAVTAESPLVPGSFGILEPPADATEVAAAELDVLLVPGLAFDTEGRRLGYGGGYYDETARRLRGAALNPGRGFLVGVGFDFQLIPSCPAGEADVAIECVVTDARVVRRGGR